MTNEEAIETLENLKNLLVNKTNIEAIDFSIAALREKADKDRRYVVHSYETMGKVYWCVYDKYQHRSVASEIATREAAQSIAWRHIVKPKEVRWRAERDHFYWFVSFLGNAQSDKEAGYLIDDARYAIGNYFRTREEAESSNKARAMRDPESER